MELDSSSGATKDDVGPVASNCGKELLTVAEDRGSIDRVVGEVE